jgi:hypothetical protein
VENVVDTLQNISHEFLLVLHLNGRIWHQQGIRYVDGDALNLSVVRAALII